MHGIVVAPPPESRRQFAQKLRSASIESTTRARSVEEVITAPLELGASVYLTALPGDRPEALVAAAARLRRAGLNPVPHLGARHVVSRGEFEALLLALTCEAGVTQVLVIGGDLDHARGPFESSLDILQSGVLERAGIRRVGLAAYPEGHPRIAQSALDAAIAAKIEYLRKTGIAPYVVTQFCFAADPIRDWLRRFSEAFPDIPVHIGLAGPAAIPTLVKYGISCGIGASLRALRRNVGLNKLFTEASPAPIIEDVLRDRNAGERIAQFHFFTFGGIRRTAEWIKTTTAEDLG